MKMEQANTLLLLKLINLIKMFGITIYFTTKTINV